MILKTLLFLQAIVATIDVRAHVSRQLSGRGKAPLDGSGGIPSIDG